MKPIVTEEQHMKLQSLHINYKDSGTMIFFLLLFCIYISEVIEEQKFDNWQNKQHKAKEKEEG